MVRRPWQFDGNGRNEAQGFKSRKKTELFRMHTKTVVAIAVIFLVPELPYGLYYLVTVSLGHSEKAILPLKVNRLYLRDLDGSELSFKLGSGSIVC